MRYSSFRTPLLTRNFRIGSEQFSNLLPRDSEAVYRKLTAPLYLVYRIT
jgi:hypothetical protein